MSQLVFTMFAIVFDIRICMELEQYSELFQKLDVIIYWLLNL